MKTNTSFGNIVKVLLLSLGTAVFAMEASGAASWCKEDTKTGLCTEHGSCRESRNEREEELKGTRSDPGCAGGKRNIIIIRTSVDVYANTRTITKYQNTSGHGNVSCPCPSEKDECKGPKSFLRTESVDFWRDGDCA